jgi:hypothetical protein
MNGKRPRLEVAPRKPTPDCVLILVAALGFRSSCVARRCVVLLDGFYEWHNQGGGGGAASRKQPYHISTADGTNQPAMCMAGLYDVYRGKVTWSRWVKEENGTRQNGWVWEPVGWSYVGGPYIRGAALFDLPVLGLARISAGEVYASGTRNGACQLLPMR